MADSIKNIPDSLLNRFEPKPVYCYRVIGLDILSNIALLSLAYYAKPNYWVSAVGFTLGFVSFNHKPNNLKLLLTESYPTSTLVIQYIRNAVISIKEDASYFEENGLKSKKGLAKLITSRTIGTPTDVLLIVGLAALQKYALSSIPYLRVVIPYATQFILSTYIGQNLTLARKWENLASEISPLLSRLIR
jgi:hypothetical protein